MNLKFSSQPISRNKLDKEFQVRLDALNSLGRVDGTVLVHVSHTTVTWV